MLTRGCCAPRLDPLPPAPCPPLPAFLPTSDAQLRKAADPPVVVMYFHENQLTTPTANGDRDVKHNTHWHYGAANWRSILAADVILFNSHTHLQQFAEALPTMIKQNSPRDCKRSPPRSVPPPLSVLAPARSAHAVGCLLLGVAKCLLKFQIDAR